MTARRLVDEVGSRIYRDNPFTPEECAETAAAIVALVERDVAERLRQLAVEQDRDGFPKCAASLRYAAAELRFASADARGK